MPASAPYRPPRGPGEGKSLLPRGRTGARAAAAILLAFVWSCLLLTGCKPSFDPVDIRVGDICAKCRNPIANPVVAGEITFVGGEVMKFDDLGCLVSFHYGIDSTTAPHRLPHQTRRLLGISQHNSSMQHTHCSGAIERLDFSGLVTRGTCSISCD